MTARGGTQADEHRVRGGTRADEPRVSSLAQT